MFACTIVLSDSIMISRNFNRFVSSQDVRKMSKKFFLINFSTLFSDAGVQSSARNIIYRLVGIRRGIFLLAENVSTIINHLTNV